MDINEISTEELAAKLERGEDFKLVMTFHDWAFKAKHIPGSINITSKEEAQGLINSSDEVVVYCVNANCLASVNAYHAMAQEGYNVRRYAGGIEAWESAGHPLEGEDTDRPIEPDNNFLAS